MSALNGASNVSRSLKSRPRSCGMFKVRKYPGVTTDITACGPPRFHSDSGGNLSIQYVPSEEACPGRPRMPAAELIPEIVETLARNCL
jgi:hypothetical protein